MQTPLTNLLRSFYGELRSHFGHRKWWPADTPLEVCIGAILTQNTAWKNVAKAIERLKDASAVDPFTIYRLSHEELAALIRPAGYFNVKAGRVKNFISHLVQIHDGNLEAFLSQPMESLRGELLSIKGVGKETADSILLYAAAKPIFVVDAYTKRVLHRHGLIDGRADYDTAQDLFHSELAPDVELYNDFHAQFVAVGHHYCKKKPRCELCPLRGFLPDFDYSSFQ